MRNFDMSNTHSVSTHRYTRSGRIKSTAAVTTRKSVKLSESVRRAVLEQRSFLVSDRVSAADEFDLLDVLNAMARRPRHSETIDAAVMAIWSQLPQKNKPSIYDADLRSFVVHYPWRKHNDLMPALSAALAAVREWTSAQDTTKKGN
jgi:predicted site-specific integrase-resolvase